MINSRLVVALKSHRCPGRTKELLSPPPSSPRFPVRQERLREGFQSRPTEGQSPKPELLAHLSYNVLDRLHCGCFKGKTDLLLFYGYTRKEA